MAVLSILEPTEKTTESYAAALESQGLVGGTIRRFGLEDARVNVHEICVSVGVNAEFAVPFP